MKTSTATLDSARAFISEQGIEEELSSSEFSALVVSLAWTRQHPESLQPGRGIIHPSVGVTGEVISLSENVVEGSFDGDRRNFPLDQVALIRAAELASKMLLLSSENQALALLERRSEALVNGS